MTAIPASRARQSIEGVLRERLGSLSLEEKIRLLTGADFWSLHPEPAIGLRRLVLSDGPAGVRGELWDERDPSANIPSPTALAASWDEARVERLGRLLAAEARRKGVDVLLAPTVNLHRSPYGGRHFECFSEDPLLTARIGVAYVRGVQAGGVAATVKHFVANDSETERFTLDARVDERALRERYLAPFEPIVGEAGVWAVMAAYNSINGVTATEHPMLARGPQGRVGLRRGGHVGLVRRPVDRTGRPAPGWTWSCPAPAARGATGWSRPSGTAGCPRRRSTTRCCGCCGWPPGWGPLRGSTRRRRPTRGPMTPSPPSCGRARPPGSCWSATPR